MTMLRLFVLLACVACASGFSTAPRASVIPSRRLPARHAWSARWRGSALHASGGGDDTGSDSDDDSFDYEAAFRAKVKDKASKPKPSSGQRPKRLDPPGATETADLLSASGWAGTVGLLGLTVVLAVMTQLNAPNL